MESIVIGIEPHSVVVNTDTRLGLLDCWLVVDSDACEACVLVLCRRWGGFFADIEIGTCSFFYTILQSHAIGVVAFIVFLLCRSAGFTKHHFICIVEPFLISMRSLWFFCWRMDDVCGFKLSTELFLGGMLLLFESERRATRPKEVELDSDLVLELVQLGNASL